VGPNWNAVDPLARQLVLDALRYARNELGVDGFRFDLAPILGNGCSDGCFAWDPDDPGGVLARAPIEIDALMIAEPWGSTGDAYRAGQFPPGWAEWNDRYRDDVRADLNRLGVQDVPLRAILEGLNGAPARYGDDGRQPWSSVTYVVAHDGFTLRDLFACDEPDNDQPWPYGPSSGGSTNNLSWDQGGDVVQQRRVARTALALTLVSAGIPMFNGGDELLRSQRCNNNPYNLDSVATWIDWAALGEDPDAASFRRFTQAMLAFRAAHPALRPAAWRPEGALRVFAADGSATDAVLDDPDQHAMAVMLDGPLGGDPARAVLVLYNGWSDGVDFALPASPSGERWRLFADTHEWLEGDDNTTVLGQEPALPDDSYLLGERSLAVLVDP
jgi:glycogen operon protein